MTAATGPTECFPPVATASFPLRLGATSQASALGINPSSRWKKLLIRSYRLPVLWTLIKNREMPSSIRQTTRSHPYGCNFSRAIRATSASSASCATGPAERKRLNSFIAAAAASRIFRTRSPYLASNSLLNPEAMRSFLMLRDGGISLFGHKNSRGRHTSGRSGLNTADDPAQMSGERDQ